MKFTTYSLSLLLTLGITISNAEAFSVARDVANNGVSPLALEVVTTSTKKKSVKMRSVSYVTGKLKAKGYAVRDARRKGQIYMFRSSKNGFNLLISVDARNGKIVGVKILSAPAGKKPRKPKSAGNRFVDETYEFGYVVTEADYLTYYEFTSVEYSSTEVYTSYSLETSEFVSYESISTETTDTSVTYEADDLDQGDAGDDEGNSEASVAADDMPDEGVAEDAPADDTTAVDCPPEGDGTDACPSPEATVDEAPVDEPQQDEAPVDEPQQDEAPADEPQEDEAPAEEPQQDEAPAEEAPAEEEAPVEE